jgi:short-subunit dehydrogenase involved in D-alanine esterification of teichoic acids
LELKNTVIICGRNSENYSKSKSVFLKSM